MRYPFKYLIEKMSLRQPICEFLLKCAQRVANFVSITTQSTVIGTTKHDYDIRNELQVLNIE